MPKYLGDNPLLYGSKTSSADVGAKRRAQHLIQKTTSLTFDPESNENVVRYRFRISLGECHFRFEMARITRPSLPFRTRSGIFRALAKQSRAISSMKWHFLRGNGRIGRSGKVEDRGLKAEAKR